MRVLELFSGSGCISSAFRARGHETFTVDWEAKNNPTLILDIEELTPLFLSQLGCGIPDVIWAAPDCTTYSLAAISHHRQKNISNGNLDPKSPYAEKCDRVNKWVLYCIEYFRLINPDLIFFIENPRAGLQKMEFMQSWNVYKHVITYCKYQTDLPISQRRMKPTNIWTNCPNAVFEPPCNYGDPCHQAAPRGSKLGTQGLKNHSQRSEYPRLLCEKIVDFCEEYKGGLNK